MPRISSIQHPWREIVGERRKHSVDPNLRKAKELDHRLQRHF